MRAETELGATNYNPLEVVLSKGQGPFVWDVDDRKYYDFLASYSACNQGHCHPKLVKAMQEQIGQLTLTSRAFFTAELPKALQFMKDYFGYDRCIFMNTGAEAVETAFKMGRKWGYDIKGIPANKAEIVFCVDNFHGRTLVPVSASTDPVTQGGFGPFVPGITLAPYNDVKALDKILANPNVAAFIFEPLQGEAGVVVPSEDYIQEVRRLCTKHNVLMIADEIQSGLGRTGKRLCIDHAGVKADAVILGKALSGGMYPVSCVLASNEAMLRFVPGSHGSTYGGNPVAARITQVALSVLRDEGMIENSQKLGELFRNELRDRTKDFECVKEIRGQGLMNAMVIAAQPDGRDALDLCYILRDEGLLAKPTRQDIIRFTPPLVLTDKDVHVCVDIIVAALNKFAK